MRLSKTSNYSQNLGWDNVKIVIDETIEPTPIPVDEFKGFAVSGSTATVNYTKATNTNPEAITLYIAEYAGNKLVQVNLLVIDTTEQAVGTTAPYSVSLPNTATGTVKAMLLDANLVPLF